MAGDIDIGDWKVNRERYHYIPARLVRANVGEETDFILNGICLKPEYPSDWGQQKETTSETYSSIKLDQFHQYLLNSNNEFDVLHGLLSVAFWGFASGSDGRLTIGRALKRSHALLEGRKNAIPQGQRIILAQTLKAREFLRGGQIDKALLEAMEIKFLGMSFSSKLLAFIDPTICAVYDDVISKRLEHQGNPDLRAMHISTALGTSRIQKQRQTEIYADWCNWCCLMAKSSNASKVRWKDWDGTLNDWRAIDIERAFFSLGRERRET